MNELAHESTDVQAVPFGRFLLLRPLVGAEGANSVAIAYDTGTKRIAVVKRLGTDKRSDAIAAARFRDEIKVASRLTHPNLITALDSGEVNGEAFLELEWVAGKTSAAVVQRAAAMERHIPLPILGGILVQVCAALKYAHGQLDFVHRDISPANVMVGYDGIVRLIDYGMALSSVKSTQTMPGVIAGTVGFIAPERAAGRADRRSDLFALAAVCWNVATTAPLVSNGEDESTKVALCERLARFRRDAPVAFGEFLWTALHRDPARRFQSAEAMGDALQRCLGVLAPQHEIASYLDGLFSHEKRSEATELAKWTSLYELGAQSHVNGARPSVGLRARSTATAVLPRARTEPGRSTEKMRDGTVQPPRSHRRVGFLAAGLAAGLLSATGIIVALRNQTDSRLVENSSAKTSVTPMALTPPAPPVAVTSPARADEPLPAAPSTDSLAVRDVQRARSRKTPPPAVHSVDQEIARANVLIERGQTASARQLLDELTRQPGARPRALVASAKLEWHQGNYDEAIRIASQASRAGAGVEAVSVRAFAELDARLYEQAVRDFKHVLELNPGDTDARDALGAAEQQLRKTDR